MRICDISHERWEICTVLAAGAAGVAVALCMEHLRWASAAVKFWDESVIVMHTEERTDGTDQGGEGQEPTQNHKAAGRDTATDIPDHAGDGVASPAAGPAGPCPE